MSTTTLEPYAVVAYNSAWDSPSCSCPTTWAWWLAWLIVWR